MGDGQATKVRYMHFNGDVDFKKQVQERLEINDFSRFRADFR